MSKKEQLNQDLKSAMREGDRVRRDTLRMLLAAIKQVEIDTQSTLDEQELDAVLQKEAKKRQEAIADYTRAGMPESAAGERAELVIIEEYLPQQVSEEEIEARAREIVAQKNLSGPKAIGEVMRPLMEEFRGRADGRVVNEIVRRLLKS
jgi:uncharacterized protein YqeY